MFLYSLKQDCNSLDNLTSTFLLTGFLYSFLKISTFLYLIGALANWLFALGILGLFPTSPFKI